MKASILLKIICIILAITAAGGSAIYFFLNIGDFFSSVSSTTASSNVSSTTEGNGGGDGGTTTTFTTKSEQGTDDPADDSDSWTEGLEFALNEDGESYYVKGYGSSNKHIENRHLVIPSEHNGLPVTGVGDGAFEHCNYFDTVRIPNSVTYIGDYAFHNCMYLRDLVIPDSVTYIGEAAFLGATMEPDPFFNDYITISITEFVAYIGPGAFSSMGKVAAIEVNENNPNYMSIDGNLYTKDGASLISYSMGKKDTEFIIPNTVTLVGAYAFCNNHKLESVQIPESVTEIGDCAFFDCLKLTNISFGGTVEMWNEITFGRDWHYHSTQTEVNCSNGTLTVD